MDKLFLILLLFSSCSPVIKPVVKDYYFKSNLLSVVDGDTIKVISLNDIPPEVISNEIYIIRLLYIDAPEVEENQRFERFVDKLYRKGIYLKRNEIIKLGYLSLSNLSSVIRQNDLLEIHFNKNEIKDIYGRILGFVYKGNTNINLYQVETGFAFSYFYNKKADKVFINAEKNARKMKKGLWKILD